MKYFLVALSLLVGTNAFAYKSGSLTCHLEILSKQNFPKLEKLAPFKINIAENYLQPFKANSLSNEILVAYTPGIENNGDIDVLVVDLKYEGSEAGVDAPAVNNRDYTFYLSKDDSELVGAYLKCTSDLKN